MLQSMFKRTPWLLFMLVVGAVFLSMLAFEFLLEHQIEIFLGMSANGEDAITHWKYTLYTTLAVAIALLVPFRIVGRTERENQDLMKRYKALFEQTADSVIVLKPSSKGAPVIIDANDAALEQHGYSRSELMGKPISFLDSEASKKKVSERMRLLQTGKIVNFEAEHFRKDGTTFLVEVTANRLVIDDNELIYTIERDITERKLAEQKLHNALAEKEVMMREIHHRVKNNMQMMGSLLELQSDYVTDETALGYFRDSRQRIQSMAMIHEQLYHNRNLAQIDFVAYLQTLADNLRGQYGDQCKQVDIQINAQPCTLPVDTAVSLGLVINELVSNALKHAFPKNRSGKLHVNLQRDEGKVILEVADDGVGLPPGFDPHHSPGFGMRIVTLMVEKQLDGKLVVGPNAHQGTRVVCEIGVKK